MKKISFLMAAIIMFLFFETGIFTAFEKKASAAMTDVVAIKVGSYNIHNADNGKNIDAIANQIKECGLDVIGFQEVDRYTSRCNMDVMKEFATRLGYYYAFFPTLNVHNGEYGIGTLSRWPIVSTNITEIDYKFERRVLSHCVIKMDSGYTFNFYNTHIDYGYSTNIDDIQAAAMDKIYNTMQEPYILTGDFNKRVSFQEEHIIHSDIVAAFTNDHNVETYPGGWSIDNIMASAANHTILDGKTYISDLSDHYMVYAKILVTPTNFHGMQPENLGDSIYVKIKNVKAGKYLSTNFDGTEIYAEECNDSIRNQVWLLKRFANNIYSITNAETWQYMDVDNWGDSNGSKLHLWEDNGSSAQKFYFYNIHGKYVIKPAYTLTEQVFDVDYSSGRAQTWSYGAGATQQLFEIFNIGFQNDIPFDMGNEFTAYIKNINSGLKLASAGTDTIFKSSESGELWEFKKVECYVYKIKNLSSGKYLSVTDGSVSGASVKLADEGTGFFIYGLNNHFYIKPQGVDLLCDMDAVNKDMNLYEYGTSEQQMSAQQFDIFWISSSAFKEVDIGDTGEVYIQNFRENRYLSFDSSNMTMGTDSMTTLWTYVKNSDGSYSFFVKETGLALNVYNELNALYSQVTLATPNGSHAQKFFIYSADDEYFYLRPSYSGKVLDFSSKNTLQLYGINRTNAQKFRFYTVGGDLLVNKKDNLSLKESSSYTKNESGLFGVKIGTTASEIISQFNNESVAVFDLNGNKVSPDSVCGTGYKVKLIQGSTVLDQCDIIIKGDVDGDGKITTTDYLRIKSFFIKTYNLEGAALLAADVEESGVIDATDYLRIKYIFLGKS